MAGRKGKDTCEVCNKPIVKKMYWKKYCSDGCRLTAWAKRRVEKMR